MHIGGPKRRFVLAYTFLVAVPVMGLMGVLKSGRGLRAPVSMNGEWKLQADSKQLASFTCASYVSLLTRTPITISQSGKDVTLTLAGKPWITAAGIIEGTTLRAIFGPLRGASSRAACNARRPLMLKATVGEALPRSLKGELSEGGCDSCPLVQFYAAKQNTIQH